jgi:hypothetical protein
VMFDTSCLPGGRKEGGRKGASEGGREGGREGAMERGGRECVSERERQRERERERDKDMRGGNGGGWGWGGGEREFLERYSTMGAQGVERERQRESRLIETQRGARPGEATRSAASLVMLDYWRSYFCRSSLFVKSCEEEDTCQVI